tara:strand:- start:457 stop:1575 length:1119 start_codon:yes stop_codon:yes gene_type:complete
MADAKDIKFQQYDGRTLLDINDGGYIAIANGATGPGQLRLYEDTDLGTNYSAFQVGTQSGDITYTLPTADGSDGHALKTDGNGTLTWGAVAANTPTSADGQALGSASLEWSDLFLADGGTVTFGNDQEIILTHVADTGLTLKHTATADDKPVSITLQTGETDIAADDVIGKIDFQAPDEGTGTDAILVAAGIEAVSEGDFSSSSNATKLSFKTGASEAATEKASLSSAGVFTATSFAGSGSSLTGILPSGVIVMWSGAVSAIPSGWVICDGSNSTPNLTGKFILHADADSGGTNDVGDTGGSTTSGATTLSTSQIPSHQHTYEGGNTSAQGGASWGSGYYGSSHNSGSTGGGGSHTHTATPPYYALAYIMKT